MDDYWIWGSSVVKDDYGYSMYASRWPKKYPMFEGYIYCSEIVRAWSETLEGPYKFVEKVLPSTDAKRWDGRMAHNPVVCFYQGRYLLYYIASTYNHPLPSSNDMQANPEQMMKVYHQIRIGLAIADKPSGPWIFTSEPILKPRDEKWDNQIVTNPTPCISSDGTIYLYYRSNTPDGLRIGLAIAEFPEGPYRRVKKGPILEGYDVEDPYVWHDGGIFHMVAKDMTGKISGEARAGAYFRSMDGIEWQPGVPRQAYSRSVSFSTGHSTTLGSLERPQPFWNEEDRLECLFAAVSDGTNGFYNAENTWNMAIPACMSPEDNARVSDSAVYSKDESF